MKYFTNTKFLIGFIISFIIYLSIAVYGTYSKKNKFVKNELNRLFNKYTTVISQVKGDTYLYMGDLFTDRKEELIEIYPYLSNILKKEKCGLETFHLEKTGICYGFYSHRNNFSLIFDGKVLEDYLSYFDILLCKKTTGFGDQKEFCKDSNFAFTPLSLVLPIKIKFPKLFGASVYSLLRIPLIELLYFILSFVILYILLFYKKNAFDKLNHDNSKSYDFKKENKELNKKLQKLQLELETTKRLYREEESKFINYRTENSKTTNSRTESFKNLNKIEQNREMQDQVSNLNILNKIKNIIYNILSSNIKPLKSKSKGLEIISPPKIKRYIKAISLLRSFYDTVSMFVKALSDLDQQDVLTVKDILSTNMKKIMLNLHILEETLNEIGLIPMVEELKKINLLKKENTSLIRQIDSLKVDSMELVRLKLAMEKILKMIEGDENGKS